MLTCKCSHSEAFPSCSSQQPRSMRIRLPHKLIPSPPSPPSTLALGKDSRRVRSTLARAGRPLLPSLGQGRVKRCQHCVRGWPEATKAAGSSLSSFMSIQSESAPPSFVTLPPTITVASGGNGEMVEGAGRAATVLTFHHSCWSKHCELFFQERWRMFPPAISKTMGAASNASRTVKSGE